MSVIRIATCGDLGLAGKDVGAIAASRARETIGGDVELLAFENSLELIEAILRPSQDALIDLVICAEELKGMTALHMAQDLAEAGEVPAIVVIARSGEAAYRAMQLGIDDFIVGEPTVDELEAVLDRHIQKAAAFQEGSFVVKGGGRVSRVRFADITYVETSSHDQVIHLHDGRTVRTRSTSGAMFDQMTGRGRFFKAGSSNIINLDYVKCTRDNNASVFMEDGTVISVPVRLRKSLEEALLSND